MAAGHTESSVVIDAPIDVVWEMTNDVTSWPNLFTEYAEPRCCPKMGTPFAFD
ncbi:SRPBCC family protein [Fodinicola feengrottensis]|uniref:hypothetical protein n=1 Tax=Fodinicola feengrottensis TaxID=435914 RepID=UPI0024415752|nr:hypothetical protein [Fodinicola feengrottensis]